MKNKNGSSISRIVAPAIAALMLSAGSAQAASVSYYLNQSNALPDGTNYLQVTISDGVDGAIDFLVETLSPLNDIGGSNFGIQAFAFNVVAGGDAEAGKITNLPEDWVARDKSRMSSFGFFDIKVTGRGTSRTDSLTFSLEGIDGDAPSDYAVLSTGTASSGHSFFAAKVAGFEFCPEENAGKGPCIRSGFFGADESASPIPLPATAWLLMTGVAGALVRARRRM